MFNATVFQSYHGYNPKVPVYCITNSNKPTIHRFYDTSPISPSGRYIALTEFPYEDKLPQAGDVAKVVVIDLQNAQQIYSCDTPVWDTQVGAHVQWGNNDDALYFNQMDMKTGNIYGVKVNIHKYIIENLEGTVYMVSPDGKYCISPHIKKLALVQPGYGVILPEPQKYKNYGISETDGIFITDTQTGQCRLLLSFKDIVHAMPEKFTDIDINNGAFYGFHVKYNPQGTRIAFIIRWLATGGKYSNSKNYLITCDTDGKDITMAVDAKTWRGGHHPTWCPDGTSFIMNLAFKNEKCLFPKIQSFAEKVARRLKIRFFSNASFLRFAKIHYTSKPLQIIAPNVFGSGHPTLHPVLPFMMSDAYINERVSFGDGTVPLRWVNMETGLEETFIRILTKPKFRGIHSEYRIDPHPAWDKTGKFLTFNANHDGGVRKVYIADFSQITA
jgi:hypothetical protein